PLTHYSNVKGFRISFVASEKNTDVAALSQVNCTFTRSHCFTLFIHYGQRISTCGHWYKVLPFFPGFWRFSRPVTESSYGVHITDAQCHMAFGIRQIIEPHSSDGCGVIH